MFKSQFNIYLQALEQDHSQSQHSSLERPVKQSGHSLLFRYFAGRSVFSIVVQSIIVNHGVWRQADNMEC